jgi:hypothetical protein
VDEVNRVYFLTKSADKLQVHVKVEVKQEDEDEKGQRVLSDDGYVSHHEEGRDLD